MRRLFVSLAAVAVIGLVVGGCGQAAPAPAPTKAPAAPTAAPAAAPKAAEPTKAPEPAKAAPSAAPAAQPTAAPAKKVDYPTKGKAISLIVVATAGGSSDVGARILTLAMEKDLGVPVQVANKPGGGGQVGFTEFAATRPDGYTIGLTAVPHIIGLYLDPRRQTTFDGKSFQPLAMTIADPVAIAVKPDSPYKTTKDLVDAAKANPAKIKLGTAGLGSSADLTLLETERVANVKFAQVNFEGGAPAVTALLGGHIDASMNVTAEILPHVKSEKLRIIGIADKQGSPHLQGVKTMESDGYKVYMVSSHIISAPTGTPKEIVDILSGSIKKALQAEDVKQKYLEMGVEVRFLDSAQAASFWSDMEKQMGPLMDLVVKRK